MFFAFPSRYILMMLVTNHILQYREEIIQKNSYELKLRHFSISDKKNEASLSCLLLVLQQVFVRNYSLTTTVEDLLRLYVHFHSNQTHFHAKRFARRLQF